MSVLVDSSVWIDFFNGHDSPEANTLAAYLQSDTNIATCAPIMAECLCGFRLDKSYRQALVYFELMTHLTIQEPEDWVAAADLYRRLRKQGVTVRSLIDCMIMRIAEVHDAHLLAKDRDMRLIIESGLVAVRSAPLLV